ncbi:TlpA disulfide reductase family protein [Flavobacterium sp.]|uniref:peroxiredoxin family protein n=1 Tax=Flavobacterium sp. TaxID=239 RepID=UPI00286C01E5|nr:TlpA disulfide reductase family protein [Flavobacterium sp.]
MKKLKIQSATILFSTIQKVSFLIIIFFALNACSGSDDATTNPTPTPSGTTAPAFTLTSLDNTQVKLSDYSNKVVVLFFFGNTCPSCKAIAPSFESKLVTPFASKTDYQILGLDQWDGNASSVQGFKTATGVSFPLLLTASSVAASYKTTYDRLVVIDKAGKIVFTGTQGAAGDVDAVKLKVQSLIN